MKQWEQIAFAIALAAFGYVLYNYKASGKTLMGPKAKGVFPPNTVPAFYSINTINAGTALPPNIASTVPLAPDSAGQEFANGYLDPEETLFPTSDYGQ